MGNAWQFFDHLGDPLLQNHHYFYRFFEDITIGRINQPMVFCVFF